MYLSARRMVHAFVSLVKCVRRKMDGTLQLHISKNNYYSI